MKTLVLRGVLGSLALLAQGAESPFPTAASTNSSAPKSNVVAPAARVDPAPAAAAQPAPATKPSAKDLLERHGTFTNSLGMEFVKLSATLWAGRFEVTQREYFKVMGSNPSRFVGERHPVDSVSWTEAREFCRRLSELERKAELLPDGYGYTLPTQQQWSALLAGAELQDAVTSLGASRSGTAPVGSRGPNGLGLYDVRGNVWEWCLDPQDKPWRVLRGGAYDSFVEVQLRPEFIWFSRGPDDRQANFGFRCVLAAESAR